MHETNILDQVVIIWQVMYIINPGVLDTACGGYKAGAGDNGDGSTNTR